MQALISQRFCSDILKMGGEVYLVGGCVRDSFLHRPLKDFDIVVRKIPIDPLVALLKKSGQTNLVGKSFGVIKFRPQENPEREIDIALPRTEVSTGSGHKDFQVTSDENLAMAMDLSRRDFTINAMAMNVQNDQLLDPFGGKADLENKITELSPTPPTEAHWTVREVEFVKNQPHAYVVYHDTHNVFRILVETGWKPYHPDDKVKEATVYRTIAIFEAAESGWRLVHGEDLATGRETVKINPN